MGIATAVVAGVGLVWTSAVARAGAPGETSSSQVPVLSDDEAGWDQQRPPAYLAAGTSVVSGWFSFFHSCMPPSRIEA